MLGLSDRGMQAGRDFAVAGFDDVPEAALSRPALTTVATQPFQVGEEAARLLLRRLADPHGPPERVILPTRLIVRETCGAAKARDPRLDGKTAGQTLYRCLLRSWEKPALFPGPSQ